MLTEQPCARDAGPQGRRTDKSARRDDDSAVIGLEACLGSLGAGQAITDDAGRAGELQHYPYRDPRLLSTSRV